MGHTLADWRRQVLDLLRDPRRRTFGLTQVDQVGIAAAFGEHSVNRPRMLVVEVAGSNADTFDLPTGWVAGFSHLEQVETPPNQSPPVFLDVQAAVLIRKTGALATEQILLDRKVSQQIRWWFTAPWPIPTADATIDPLDEAAFQAVSTLAASLCLTAKAIEIASCGGDGASLTAAAKTYRGVYLRYLGLGDDQLTSNAPASRPFDFDPQYYSMFHGGRQ